MSTFHFILILPLVLALSKLPKNYQSLPPESKQSLLWLQIESSVYNVSNLPINETKPPGTLQLFKVDYLKPTFLHVSDELPPGRKKLMDALGTAANVKLEIYPNSSYSGIFKSGGIGITRLSQRIRDSNHVTPMVALKIFINGKPSENMFLSYTEDGQGNDQSFFRHNLTNVVTPATEASLVALAGGFKNATAALPGGPLDRPESTSNMPLVQAASVTCDSQNKDTLLPPYQVSFVPSPGFEWAANDTEDYRAKIARMVSPGTVLYSIFARARPDDTNWTPLGKLVTQTRFIASEYGDKVLFFQHPTRQWSDLLKDGNS